MRPTPVPFTIATGSAPRHNHTLVDFTLAYDSLHLHLDLHLPAPTCTCTSTCISDFETASSSVPSPSRKSNCCTTPSHNCRHASCHHQFDWIPPRFRRSYRDIAILLAPASPTQDFPPSVIATLLVARVCARTNAFGQVSSQSPLGTCLSVVPRLWDGLNCYACACPLLIVVCH